MRRILALLNRRSVCSCQAEDRGAVDGVVGAHALEGAAAVVQRVAQHVDLGVAPVHEFTVHPDLAVTVVQCGGSALMFFVLWGRGMSQKLAILRRRPTSPRRQCTALPISQPEKGSFQCPSSRTSSSTASKHRGRSRSTRSSRRLDTAAFRPLQPLAGKIRRLGRAPRRGARPAGRIHRRPVAARIHDREQGAAGFGGAPQGRGARRADRGHHRPQARQEGKEGAQGRRHARAAAAGLHAPRAHRGVDRPGRAPAGGQRQQRGARRRGGDQPGEGARRLRRGADQHADRAGRRDVGLAVDARSRRPASPSTANASSRPATNRRPWCATPSTRWTSTRCASTSPTASARRGSR